MYAESQNIDGVGITKLVFEKHLLLLNYSTETITIKQIKLLISFTFKIRWWHF